MTSPRFLALFAALLLVVLGGSYIAAKKADATARQVVPQGVSIGGVPVGGLTPQAAEAKVVAQRVAPLQKPVEVTHPERSFTLRNTQLTSNAKLQVNQAMQLANRGSLVSRTWDRLQGKKTSEDLPLRFTYSKPALTKLVKRVQRALNRAPTDARLVYAPAKLRGVEGTSGRAVKAKRLRQELEAALLSPRAPRKVAVRTLSVAPEVSRADLAERYPTVLTVNRATRKLRLWKKLRLVKTYDVAVGMAGMDTPAGLYTIADKQTNPVWYVPKSAWAGSLAGKVIPPGPNNPIKARWMGFFDGAGIHGTADAASIGSAASHGCVRMRIPDVIELYERVPVGTPIYLS